MHMHTCNQFVQFSNNRRRKKKKHVDVEKRVKNTQMYLCATFVRMHSSETFSRRDFVTSKSELKQRIYDDINCNDQLSHSTRSDDSIPLLSIFPLGSNLSSTGCRLYMLLNGIQNMDAMMTFVIQIKLSILQPLLFGKGANVFFNASVNG